jgi:hypothetical protein
LVLFRGVCTFTCLRSAFRIHSTIKRHNQRKSLSHQIKWRPT